MATRSPVQIPLFTQREIWVAECCALALWNGISFETLEETLWGDELWTHLISSCFEESQRKDQKRAERQQASHKKLKQSTGKS